jgi:hypothetical protein
MIDAKKRWMGDLEYGYQEQSSLLGAAMLGRFWLSGQYDQAQPARLAENRRQS